MNTLIKKGVVKGMTSLAERQRIGGIFAIWSAILLVLVLTLFPVFAMKGVTGADVYEKTVNGMATHPIANWLFMLVGLFGTILFFWSIEAIDDRLRNSFPQLSRNVSSFGYLSVLLFSLYTLLPAGVLHDLANSDQNIAEAMKTIHPILEISLVLSSLSSIFFGIWMLQIGMLFIRSGAFSKVFAIFTIVISIIVVCSGAYEALYGRGGGLGMVLIILTNLGAFVVWKIWVGWLLLRKPVA
jgi:hypothetical protein